MYCYYFSEFVRSAKKQQNNQRVPSILHDQNTEHLFARIIWILRVPPSCTTRQVVWPLQWRLICGKFFITRWRQWVSNDPTRLPRRSQVGKNEETQCLQVAFTESCSMKYSCIAVYSSAKSHAFDEWTRSFPTRMSHLCRTTIQWCCSESLSPWLLWGVIWSRAWSLLSLTRFTWTSNVMANSDNKSPWGRGGCSC